MIAVIDKTSELRAALEAARNGLQWYRDMHPEDNSSADDEMMAQIDAALNAVQPVPASEPPEGEAERRMDKPADAEVHAFNCGWRWALATPTAAPAPAEPFELVKETPYKMGFDDGPFEDRYVLERRDDR